MVWKAAVVTFEILRHYLLETLKKTMRISVRTLGVPSEVQNGEHLKRSEEYCCSRQLTRREKQTCPVYVGLLTASRAVRLCYGKLVGVNRC
jgi:hypothetical protein